MPTRNGKRNSELLRRLNEDFDSFVLMAAMESDYWAVEQMKEAVEFIKAHPDFERLSDSMPNSDTPVLNLFLPDHVIGLWEDRNTDYLTDIKGVRFNISIGPEVSSIPAWSFGCFNFLNSIESRAESLVVSESAFLYENGEFEFRHLGRGSLVIDDYAFGSSDATLVSTNATTVDVSYRSFDSCKALKTLDFSSAREVRLRHSEWIGCNHRTTLVLGRDTRLVDMSSSFSTQEQLEAFVESRIEVMRVGGGVDRPQKI